MTLYESDLKITVGAVVLLDYGDWIEGMFQHSANRETQVVSFVEGTGIKTIDRGNESNQLSFTAIIDHGSVEAAKRFQFQQAIALRTGGVTTTINIQYHSGSIVIPNSTVISKPSTTFERFSRFSYTILGGALTDTLVDERLLTEAGSPMETEDGETMIDG